jgi:hypothetical protein
VKRFGDFDRLALCSVSFSNSRDRLARIPGIRVWNWTFLGLTVEGLVLETRNQTIVLPQLGGEGVAIVRLDRAGLAIIKAPNDFGRHDLI